MSTDLRRDIDGAAPWMHDVHGASDNTVRVSLIDNDDVPADAALPFDDPADVIDLRQRLFTQDGTRRLAECSTLPSGRRDSHRRHGTLLGRVARRLRSPRQIRSSALR